MVKQIKIAVVAVEGISSFHLSVPFLVFQDAFIGQPSPFSIALYAPLADGLQLSSGFGVTLQAKPDLLQSADIIILPSWPETTTAPAETLLEELRAAHARGATLVGLCLGAFALAHSGLLDGKRATTHWAYAQQFSAQFPAVHFDAEPLYVEQERLLTSAGTVAAIDCCLHILRKLAGSKLANQIARMLVTSPFRHGGQKQYIQSPLPTSAANQAINNVMQQILADLQPAYRLDEIAARCAMSRRSFTRQFKAMTGSAFGQWLLNQRLEYSQQLLEATEQPISRVAELAGFSSESNYRKQFRASYAVSPSAWRNAFSSPTQIPRHSAD